MQTVAWRTATDQGKFARHLAEIEEYTEQLRQSADAELAEQFAAACWDVMIDCKMMLEAARVRAARDAEDRAWRRARAVRTVKTPQLPTGGNDGREEN